jgi:hypothetical protein
MTSDHPRKAGPMLAKPALWCEDSLREVLRIAGGSWQSALSNAWRRVRIGRAARQSNTLKHGLYRKAAIENSGSFER